MRIYRETLLLAFAQPTKLAHGDFSRVQAYLAAHGDLAEIASGVRLDNPACVFAIDPRSDKPGAAYTKRVDMGLENGELVLLTHRLVERLETQLKKLRDGVAPAMLALPDEARTPGYPELMQRLVMHWRGDPASSARHACASTRAWSCGSACARSGEYCGPMRPPRRRRRTSPFASSRRRRASGSSPMRARADSG
ncbi:MAG TPA: hypothetical protein VLD36_16985 [Burkholderiales bacterium]|nr:hypothetical protein [Burkholderiales bacterium]